VKKNTPWLVGNTITSLIVAGLILALVAWPKVGIRLAIVWYIIEVTSTWTRERS